MRNRLFILAAACLVPAFVSVEALAQNASPSTLPADDAASAIADDGESATSPSMGEDQPRRRQFGNDGRWNERPFGERRGGGRWMRGEISDEDWQDISAFMQENFPKRWDVYVTLSKKPGRETLARDMKYRIANRYRRLMFMQQTNPNLYDVALQQARIEDEIWGAVREWQQASDSHDTSARETAHQLLRDKVKQVLLKSFEERRTRLEALRQAVEHEQKQLAGDVESLDALITARVDHLTSENPFREPVGPGPTPPTPAGGEN